MRQGTQSRYSVTAGGVQREGTVVYLWPIHVNVWQKPSNIVISLQLKIKYN